jgi:nucleoside 2-deoxyribosyltransferase
MRIYQAGPLFSTAECDFNAGLANHLRLFGHEVFLPQENEQGEDPSMIFKSDVGGIMWAQMVLANLDGPDPDSGTCWELGYGYAKGKHIMVYRTDFRIHEGFDPINLMMTESANVVIISPKLPVSLLAERIDDEIRSRWQPYTHTDK